jgi:O-Antigen ligase
LARRADALRVGSENAQGPWRMLTDAHRKGSATRIAGLLALLLFIFVFTALAVLFSGGAAFLSVWSISAIFGVLGVGLLAYLPVPSVAVQRASMFALLVFVFLAIVWPRYASIRLPGLPALSLTRISLLILLLLGVFLFSKSSAYRQRLRERVARFRVVFYALAAWLVLKVLGAFFAEVPFLSMRGVLNELISVYVPMLIALAAIESRRDIRRLLVTVLAGAVVVVLVGLYEYHVGRNVFLGLLEVDSEYLEQVLRDKVRAGSYRLQSTFAHPLTLSEFLVLTTPVAIYMAFVDGFRWLRSFLLILLMVAMAFVIVKTGSRSGIGSFAVVLGACAVMCSLRLAKVSRDGISAALYVLGAIALVVVAGVSLYLMIDLLVGRTTREFNSGQARLLMWEDGLAKAALQPLLGYGQDTAARVLGFVGSHSVLTIDSYFLSVLLDGGFPSLALFVIVLGALGVIGLRSGLSGSHPDLLSILLLTSLVAFSLIKLILSLSHNHALFMVLMAVMLAGITLPGSESEYSGGGLSLRKGRM